MPRLLASAGLTGLMYLDPTIRSLASLGGTFNDKRFAENAVVTCRKSRQESISDSHGFVLTCSPYRKPGPTVEMRVHS
jgi:hypothetical protein